MCAVICSANEACSKIYTKTYFSRMDSGYITEREEEKKKRESKGERGREGARKMSTKMKEK